MDAKTVPAASGAQAIARVSTLELFFDLVFVLTITQLTRFVVEHHDLQGAIRAAAMLGVIFYMYGGYAWLTNALAADRLVRRAGLLGGMAGFLVIALAVPVAYDEGRGVAFGIAYVVVVLIHAALFARGARGEPGAIFQVLPLNVLTAALVVAATASSGDTTLALLVTAIVIVWGVSWARSARAGFDIGAEHFVERHGLVVIVAIGESIVAIGAGSEGLSLSIELIGTAVLGLLLSAALWWTYFGGDDERAVEALAEVPAKDRGLVAIVAFGYWHLVMLLGIVLTAAGLKKLLAHPVDPAADYTAWFLASGVALFLLGEALFRRSLRIGRSTARLAAAVAVLAAVPIATQVSGLAALTSIVLLMGGLFAVEAMTGDGRSEVVAN